MDAQSSDFVWTTSISIFEIRFGLDIPPNGKRKTALQDDFEAMLSEDLDFHVLNFDREAEIEADKISAELYRLGRPVVMRDVQIAGIISARQATLVTRHCKHLQDIDISLVNPWG